MRTSPSKVIVTTLALTLMLAGGFSMAQDSEKSGELEGSIELLYRGVGTAGSDQKYREDFDGLDSGFRLSSLNLNWLGADADAGSGFADFFRLDAAGLGGDPYESATFTVGRRDVYELNLNHSRQVYLYDLFELAGDTDGSTWDATRSITDIDLTIHATDHVDLFVEYRENRRDGTSLFMKDVATDLFRMETPLDQEVQRYTVGGSFELGPVDLVFRHSLRRYDYRFNNTTQGDAGLDTADSVTLTDYDWRQRDDGEADLTTVTLVTPVGPRGRLSLTAFGTLFGEDTLDSRVLLNSSGTSAQGAFTVNGGTSATMLETDHLAIDADLSFRLAAPLDFIVQFTSLDREVSGTQIRDLDANGVVDDAEGTVFDTVPGSTTREDYSMESITGLFDYEPIRKLRLRAGYRTIDRELVRSGFEFGTNDNRNDRFESDGDDTLILGAVVKPAGWLRLQADYEEGDITQAFTSVSPMETDRLRLRARLKPTKNLRIDATYLDYESTNRGSDFRRTASCTTPTGGIGAGCWNSAREGTTESLTLWHQPKPSFDYQVRWAQQDVDSVIRVRFDTELFFNSAEDGDSIYDSQSTQWSGQANVRWGDRWTLFARGMFNDSDGANSLIGPAVRYVNLIDQDYLDVELGVTHTLKSGVYLGARVRTFDYDDARRPYAYDGDILSLVAGLKF